MGCDLFSILLWVLLTLVLILLVPLALILLPSIASYFTPIGRRMRKLISLIPGPPSFPVIGSALAFFMSRQKVLEHRRECCLKYYPVYKQWLFHQPLVNVVGPKYVEAILHSQKHIDKGWIYKFFKPWLGEGLLTSSGNKWYTHRKFLTPTFHFKILEEFIPLFAERSADLVEKLAVEQLTGKPFNIVPVISRSTLGIICESAMGIQLDPENEAQKEYIKAIYDYGVIFFNRIGKPWYGIDFLFNLTPMAKRQTEILKILHSFTDNVIKNKKEEFTKNLQALQESGENETKPKGKKVRAFLELLLELSMKENVLTDQEVREEVDTFMFEGHDTASMTISWTMLMLASHPEIQDRVWEEVETQFRAKEDYEGTEYYSQAKVYNSMQLLERCIKETLRIYPSVPFISRVLAEDFQMENYLIPAGTMVNVIISGIHMNPEIFPEPDKFDPDRFLPEETSKRHPYAYVPFSAGPRNCIGQRFAMLEVKAVLAAIIRRYRLISVHDPKDVKFMHDIVLRPCDGIMLKLESRDT